MKEVIIMQDYKAIEERPVEFTHYLDGNSGWLKKSEIDQGAEKVVYLGRCGFDGDMFAVYYDNGAISIFKGHLNSGKY